MNRLRFIVVKNALSNMIRVSASAVVALALPHFLTRALDHDRFAAWVLMLQIAAYVNYMDFGLQTAVARYFAQVVERQDTDWRDRLVSTALVLLSLGAVLSVLVIAIVLAFLQHLFRQAPVSLIHELRIGIAVLTVTIAIQLALGTFTGVLVGLHRNEIPAIAMGGSRLISAIAVILAVRYTHSLIALAALFGFCNLCGGMAQYIAVRRLLPEMRLAMHLASRKIARELTRFCGTLTVWSFCMFLVSGLDVTIVGHFDFAATGAYAIAAMLTAFLTGINNSVFGAFLTPIAVLEERGEWPRIRNLVISATRFTSFVNLAATLLVFLAGHQMLRIWLGEAYAAQTLPFLEILMIANAVRLIGAPLSAALVATDQQRHGLMGAIAEAISNFSLSILGAVFVGAIGVAWGTLAGAGIGIVWTLALTISWLQRPIISAGSLVAEGFVRPMICLSPVILYVIGVDAIQSQMARTTIALAAFCCAGIITLRWGRLQFGRAATSA